MQTGKMRSLNTILTLTIATTISIIKQPALATVPWSENAKLTASENPKHQEFGSSVAFNDDFTLIGARRISNQREYPGSVIVFDTTTGTQLFKLTAPNGKNKDGFGDAVAVNGSLAVIGAPGINNEKGAAYVFDLTTGQPLYKLTVAESFGFGNFVAMDDNRIVIGDYVFNAQTGEELFQFTPPENFSLGGPVALDNGKCVIGATGTDGTEAAFVFDIQTGEQLFELTPHDPGYLDGFGTISIALQGNRVIIGSPLSDSQKFDDDFGAAYVFDVTTGEELFKLTAINGRENDLFGLTVATNGSLAIAGVLRNDDFAESAGAAYVFNLDTGEQLYEIVASDPHQSDAFGNAVAMNNNSAIVTATGHKIPGEEGKGIAYLLELTNLTGQFTVEPNILISGEPATFTLTNALPNQKLWLLYSLEGMRPTFLFNLNVIVGLTNPQAVKGSRKTDTNGNWQTNLIMPTTQFPISVYFQIVQQNALSTPVITTLAPK